MQLYKALIHVTRADGEKEVDEILVRAVNVDHASDHVGKCIEKFYPNRLDSKIFARPLNTTELTPRHKLIISAGILFLTPPSAPLSEDGIMTLHTEDSGLPERTTEVDIAEIQAILGLEPFKG